MPDTTHTTPHAQVFLSPHCDDIALSCGGLAAGADAPGLCLTLFAEAAPADTPLSAYALRLHTRWGEPDPAAGNALRRAEEAAATGRLGIDLVLLAYADAIYRAGRYTSHMAIFGPIHPDEAGLPAVLAAAVAAELAARGRGDGAILYAPLGLGHHVDHQITYEAAGLLAGRGWPVQFYEDFPYALQPDAQATRFAELGLATGPQQRNPGARRAVPAYHNIDATIETKIAAIAAYASQISSLFPSADTMPVAVRDYAAAIAAEWRAAEPDPRAAATRYAERTWRIMEF